MLIALAPKTFRTIYTSSLKKFSTLKVPQTYPLGLTLSRTIWQDLSKKRTVWHFLFKKKKTNHFLYMHLYRILSWYANRKHQPWTIYGETIYHLRWEENSFIFVLLYHDTLNHGYVCIWKQTYLKYNKIEKLTC